MYMQRNVDFAATGSDMIIPWSVEWEVSKAKDEVQVQVQVLEQRGVSYSCTPRRHSQCHSQETPAIRRPAIYFRRLCDPILGAGIILHTTLLSSRN